MKAVNAGGRLPGLDVLRSLAILWVMVFHAGTLKLGSPWPAVTQLGWVGVDLFFALSGFLIARQWFELVARPGAFKQFYLRRSFRILPAYLVVLAVYFTVPATNEREAIQPLWQFLTFTQNLLIDFSSAKTFSHAWSLCVEEHFYLVFPSVSALLLARKVNAKTVVVGVVTLVLAGMAWRAHVWFSALAPLVKPDDESRDLVKAYFERIYYPTLTRLDGLLMGIGLALIEKYRPAWWRAGQDRRWWVAGLALAVFGGCAVLFQEPISPLATIFGYPALAVAMALFVLACASPSFRPVPLAGPIATMSYSLYLSHKIALHLVDRWWGEVLREHDVLAFATFTAAVMAFGAVLYFSVERPALAWRRRL